MRTRLFFSVSLIALLLRAPCPAAELAQPASVDEVLGILKSNVPAGLTEAELNETALNGLLSALDRKAYIVRSESQAPSSTNLLPRVDVFDSSIAYLRVDRVATGLEGIIAESLKGMMKTNKLQGAVIDLRFAGGDGYEAASSTADLFIGKARPLMNWGKGMTSAVAQPTDFALPVALLVNDQTSGAAEALTAVLRDTGTGLVFGSPTAGQAAIPKDFRLSNGQVLRVATQAVELGSGAKLSGPVNPDIDIQVSLEEERAYYANAFADLSTTNPPTDSEGTNSVSATNRTSRRNRFNEADLVREHNLRSRGEGGLAVERPPQAPVVNDPVLARALDVLKGLAVVRQSKH